MRTLFLLLVAFPLLAEAQEPCASPEYLRAAREVTMMEYQRDKAKRDGWTGLVADYEGRLKPLRERLAQVEAACRDASKTAPPPGK